MIRIKRIYEKVGVEDGFRVLVDRLWPRGLSKEGAKLDEWLKDAAPSDELRRWFRHDPSRWEEFRKWYREELNQKSVNLNKLIERARGGNMTLLYAAKDKEHNNAVVLKELLEEKMIIEL